MLVAAPVRFKLVALNPDAKVEVPNPAPTVRAPANVEVAVEVDSKFPTIASPLSVVEARVVEVVEVNEPIDAVPTVTFEAVRDCIASVKNCAKLANIPPAVEVPVTVVDPKYPLLPAIELAAKVLPVILVTVVDARVDDPLTVRFVRLSEEKVVEPRTVSVPVAMMLPWIEVPYKVVDAREAEFVAENVPATVFPCNVVDAILVDDVELKIPATVLP